jgi:hypothetical protein
MTRLRWRALGASVALLLGPSACISEDAPLTPGAAPSAPPDIEFAGIVTDARTIDGQHRFTDSAGVEHAVDTDAYRMIGAYACCLDLVVLGRDADGAFLATFRKLNGPPDPDCLGAYDFGVDRGDHIELFDILWLKAPEFEGAVPADSGYEMGTRFCFDEEGRVASVIAP